MRMLLPPPLSDREKDIYRFGMIPILQEIHDEIDRQVFAAYGWKELGDKLVGCPGATNAESNKTSEQETAEEELLTRLVNLNHLRSADEKSGIIQWLRPEYQRPRLGSRISGNSQVEAQFGIVASKVERTWPADGLAQIRALRTCYKRPGRHLERKHSLCDLGAEIRRSVKNVSSRFLRRSLRQEPCGLIITHILSQGELLVWRYPSEQPSEVSLGLRSTALLQIPVALPSGDNGFLAEVGKRTVRIFPTAIKAHERWIHDMTSVAYGL